MRSVDVDKLLNHVKSLVWFFILLIAFLFVIVCSCALDLCDTHSFLTTIGIRARLGQVIFHTNLGYLEVNDFIAEMGSEKDSHKIE